MRIDDILENCDEPVFSFEFFPPKTEDGERNLRAALAALRPLEPDFASVTYGAGGSSRDKTVGLTKWLKQELGIEAMAHLSCVGCTREELTATLDGIADAGVENVLALRGDPPRGQPDWRPHPGGLSYSTELIELITRRYPFAVGAACFPETHPEAPDQATDLHFLRSKVYAGSSYLGTVSLQASKRHYRVLTLLPAVTFRTARVRLVTVGSARVQLDGLLISRT